MSSLRCSLNYQPEELKFGTSGRRGKVVDLSQLEVYLNALGELEYLQSIPAPEGGIVPGEEFFFAYDLRPSSTTYVAAERGRGEIAQAVSRAIADAGMRPVNLGSVPVPALAAYAIARRKGSMMITGSHIPFDRNGYKTNTSRGELLKEHEEPVGRQVLGVRSRLYEQPFDESPFDAWGQFKSGARQLPPAIPDGQAEYLVRYTSFFAGMPLAGMRILVYQHSAAGRDLLVELLQRLGAEVIAAGRSDTFVPIDTEAIDAAQLAVMQRLLDAEQGRFDAMVSLDGDSDRPLVLGVDGGKARFFGGDLAGMVTAGYLGAGAVVVPISCNDGIDRGPLARVLEPKTRIGSPYVIAGMEAAWRKGRRAICGWEANGGFLTGSDIEKDGRVLRALPTRDAFLPIVCVLAAAREQAVPLTELFARLPKRFSRSALLREFPRPTGLRLVSYLSPSDAAGPAESAEIRSRLERFFSMHAGFAPVAGADYTDGVRITFANGEVAHLRPSGNADEFRFYAVADTQERADEIASAGVAEPDGILRRLEKELLCSAPAS